ncbi:hypothetical protein LSAT2_010380 [Lamellibrachia satsuma]|nr:hypothetical protein LSAT2_010380 [Lamellibrachia satsuma]
MTRRDLNEETPGKQKRVVEEKKEDQNYDRRTRLIVGARIVRKTWHPTIGAPTRVGQHHTCIVDTPRTLCQIHRCDEMKQQRQ